MEYHLIEALLAVIAGDALMADIKNKPGFVLGVIFFAVGIGVSLLIFSVRVLSLFN